MIPPPPIYTLFPYTTLFRSGVIGGANYEIGAHVNAADLSACTGLTFTATVSRYTCSFTTGATITGNDYLFVRRGGRIIRSEEHTSELQSLRHLVCRLLLEKK